MSNPNAKTIEMAQTAPAQIRASIVFWSSFDRKMILREKVEIGQLEKLFDKYIKFRAACASSVNGVFDLKSLGLDDEEDEDFDIDSPPAKPDSKNTNDRKKLKKPAAIDTAVANAIVSRLPQDPEVPGATSTAPLRQTPVVPETASATDVSNSVVDMKGAKFAELDPNAIQPDDFCKLFPFMLPVEHQCANYLRVYIDNMPPPLFMKIMNSCVVVQAADGTILMQRDISQASEQTDQSVQPEVSTPAPQVVQVSKVPHISEVQQHMMPPQASRIPLQHQQQPVLMSPQIQQIPQNLQQQQQVYEQVMLQQQQFMLQSPFTGPQFFQGPDGQIYQQVQQGQPPQQFMMQSPSTPISQVPQTPGQQQQPSTSMLQEDQQVCQTPVFQKQQITMDHQLAFQQQQKQQFIIQHPSNQAPQFLQTPGTPQQQTMISPSSPQVLQTPVLQQSIMDPQLLAPQQQKEAMIGPQFLQQQQHHRQQQKKIMHPEMFGLHQGMSMDPNQAMVRIAPQAPITPQLSQISVDQLSSYPPSTPGYWVQQSPQQVQQQDQLGQQHPQQQAQATISPEQYQELSQQQVQQQVQQAMTPEQYSLNQQQPQQQGQQIMTPGKYQQAIWPSGSFENYLEAQQQMANGLSIQQQKQNPVTTPQQSQKRKPKPKEPKLPRQPKTSKVIKPTQSRKRVIQQTVQTVRPGARASAQILPEDQEFPGIPLSAVKFQQVAFDQLVLQREREEQEQQQAHEQMMFQRQQQQQQQFMMHQASIN